MTAEAPLFWWRNRDWRSLLLYPASRLYGAVAQSRMEMANPPLAGISVVCVGDLTVGGAGKTPIAISLAKAAAKSGFKPGFISRGYGGGSTEPHLVDPERHSVRRSGDEPMLLAAQAPTAVAANRKAAAELLESRGCDFAIMDDGFQSARLLFDYALIVVDAERGIGNGHIVPAGPLRAPLEAQIRRASSIVKIGEGRAADTVIRHAARAGKPLFAARTRIVNPKKHSGNRYLAFAGIGFPRKFFNSLKSTGAELVSTREYSDHHVYSESDMAELAEAAAQNRSSLITTEKDAIRFVNGGAAATEFLSKLEVLRIAVEFEPPAIAERIVRETAENFERSRFGG